MYETILIYHFCRRKTASLKVAAKCKSIFYSCLTNAHSYTHEYTNKSHRSHCSNMANFPLLIHTFCPAAITTRPRVVLFTLATYLAIYSGMLGGCIHERVRLQ